MRLLRFIPIQLTLVLILGILLGHYYNFNPNIPLTLSLIFLSALGLVYYFEQKRKTLYFALIAFCLTLCIGVLSVSLSKNNSNQYSNSVSKGAQTWHIKISETLKPNPFSQQYIAQIQALNHEKASGRLLLQLPNDSLGTAFQIDDEIIVHEKLSTINGPLNPHQFDYKSYLNNLGIQHQLRVDDAFVLLKHSSQTIYGSAATLRNKIIFKLKQANFGKEELAIIQALLLGQRDDISEDTYNSYKNAGAVHILAVSGLHIGILLLLLQFLLKPLELLPKGKTIKLIVIVALLWSFALIAGFSASIVRAVTMFSFVAYALYLNRPSNTFNILALSMFFILLVIDPKLLFQVGFQMSYAAVFAIVWIYPLLQKLWFPKHIIIRKIWQLLSVSVAAQLGVLPISLFYFHQFPGLFFISNLIIVPFLGLVLGAGILVIFLAQLDFLPNWLVRIYDTLIGWMNAIITWVAEQEAFVFQNISFDAIQLVLAYTLLFTLILFFSKPNFKKALIGAFTILCFQGYLFYATYTTAKKESLLIAHQTRNAIVLHQKGESLVVYAQDISRTKRLVTDFQVAERVSTVKNKDLLHSYTWQLKRILRIDSLGLIPKGKKKPDYLLLSQSPKLNLDRLIDSLQPKMIIADGSNYRSYAQRWAQTCAKRKLPFHYTGEKGAYYFE